MTSSGVPVGTETAFTAARKRGRVVTIECSDCGMQLEDWAEFHPYVFCLLVKHGVADPASHLASLGYVRPGVTS